MPTENTLQVAVAGSNKSEIIGYLTAQQTTNGVALAADAQVRANISLIVNGTSILLKRDIPINVFQHLRNGPHSATLELVPIPNLVEQKSESRNFPDGISSNELNAEIKNIVDSSPLNQAPFSGGYDLKDIIKLKQLVDEIRNVAETFEKSQVLHATDKDDHKEPYVGSISDYGVTM